MDAGRLKVTCWVGRDWAVPPLLSVISEPITGIYQKRRNGTNAETAETGQPLINQHLQEINQLHGQDGIVSSLRVKIGCGDRLTLPDEAGMFCFLAERRPQMLI
jgi:hypothetical protein